MGSLYQFLCVPWFPSESRYDASDAAPTRLPARTAPDVDPARLSRTHPARRGKATGEPGKPHSDCIAVLSGRPASVESLAGVGNASRARAMARPTCAWV